MTSAIKPSTVEKSARLSTGKVRLGHAELLDVVSDPSRTHSSPTTATTETVPPTLSAHERIAELENQLAESVQQIAQLQDRLTQVQDSDDTQRAELSELHADLAVRQDTAQQRGFEAGSAAAEQAVQAEWQQQLSLWENGLVELAEQYEQFRRQLNTAIADIALAATTKVIGEQLSNAEQIGKAIEHIIYESGLAGAMKIFVAPTHYEELMRNGGIALQRLGNRQIELQPDARVGYGGCLLETSGAVVDGRYEVQLNKLQTLIGEFQPIADPAA